MPQRLNPLKRYHQISVGSRRKLWAEFIHYCGSEASPLNEEVGKAIAAYTPFTTWRDKTRPASKGA